MSASLPFRLRGLAALAGSLWRQGNYPRAEIERGAKMADSQTALAPARTAAETWCGRAIAVAQLRELVAEPAVRWLGNGWQCSESETRVTLHYANGDQHELVLPPSTHLALAAGLILIPPGTASSGPGQPAD